MPSDSSKERHGRWGGRTCWHTISQTKQYSSCLVPKKRWLLGTSEGKHAPRHPKKLACTKYSQVHPGLLGLLGSVMFSFVSFPTSRSKSKASEPGRASIQKTPGYVAVVWHCQACFCRQNHGIPAFHWEKPHQKTQIHKNLTKTLKKISQCPRKDSNIPWETSITRFARKVFGRRQKRNGPNLGKIYFFKKINIYILYI